MTTYQITPSCYIRVAYWGKNRRVIVVKYFDSEDGRSRSSYRVVYVDVIQDSEVEIPVLAISHSNTLAIHEAAQSARATAIACKVAKAMSLVPERTSDPSTVFTPQLLESLKEVPLPW